MEAAAAIYVFMNVYDLNFLSCPHEKCIPFIFTRSIFEFFKGLKDLKEFFCKGSRHRVDIF